MATSNDPRVVFTRTVFRSWSGKNIPRTVRFLVILLFPFLVLFVLGMVLVGFCLLATTMMIQAIGSLFGGTSSARVSVRRRYDLSDQTPALNHSETPRGPIIDILPEPNAIPDRR